MIVRIGSKSSSCGRLLFGRRDILKLSLLISTVILNDLWYFCMNLKKNNNVVIFYIFISNMYRKNYKGKHNIIKTICITITLNNPLKVCFFNKNYTITTQTRPTQIVKVYFLLKNRVLTDF